MWKWLTERVDCAWLDSAAVEVDPGRRDEVMLSYATEALSVLGPSPLGSLVAGKLQVSDPRVLIVAPDGFGF
jgi:hypothetical protein